MVVKWEESCLLLVEGVEDGILLMAYVGPCRETGSSGVKVRKRRCGRAGVEAEGQWMCCNVREAV